MEILKSQDKKLKFTGIAIENEEPWLEDWDGVDNDQAWELRRPMQNEQGNQPNRSHVTGASNQAVT